MKSPENVPPNAGITIGWILCLLFVIAVQEAVGDWLRPTISYWPLVAIKFVAMVVSAFIAVFLWKLLGRFLKK